MKHVKQALVLLLLIFSSQGALAQTPVIVGDTDIIASFKFDPKCFEVTIDSVSNSRFDAYFSDVPTTALYVVYAASFFGTENVRVAFTTQSHSTENCGQGESYHEIYSAKGVSDSLVLMRPRSWTIDLFSDTLHGGWVGYSAPRISNNIEVPTTFSNWQLIPDSALSVSLQVKRDSIVIDSTTIAPFTSGVSTPYQINLSRGPIYKDIVVPATIRTRVRNPSRDTIIEARVTLQIHAAPYRFGSSTSVNFLSYDTQIGKLDSTDVLLQLDSKALFLGTSNLTAPFHFRVINSTQLSRTFRFYCSPTLRGNFEDLITFYQQLRDFNGDTRMDSISLKLYAIVEGGSSADFWQRTSLTNSTILSLSAGKTPQLLVGTDSSFVQSTDMGATWTALEHPVPDWLYTNGPIFGDDQGNVLIGGVYGHSLYWRLGDTVWSSLGRKTSSGNLWSVGHSISTLSRNGWVSYGESGTWRRNHGVTQDDSDLEAWIPSSNGGANQEAVILDRSVAVPSVMVFDSSSQLLSCVGNRILGFNAGSKIQALAVDNRGNYLIGTANSGVFISIDSGKRWVNAGLNVSNISSIATTPDGWIYVSAIGSGVYRSNDLGITWESVDGGLPTNSVYVLAAQPGGKIYAATHDHGLYRSILSVAAHKSIASKMPGAGLLQNYPNPFTGVTNITFNLATDEIVDITVENFLGQRIANVLHEPLTRGSYSIPFRSTSLPFGVYFCTFVTPTHSERRRIILAP